MVFRNDYAVRMLQASVPAGIEAPLRLYVTENADGTRQPELAHAQCGVRALQERDDRRDGARARPDLRAHRARCRWRLSTARCRAGAPRRGDPAAAAGAGPGGLRAGRRAAGAGRLAAGGAVGDRPAARAGAVPRVLRLRPRLPAHDRGARHARRDGATAAAGIDDAAVRAAAGGRFGLRPRTRRCLGAARCAGGRRRLPVRHRHAAGRRLRLGHAVHRRRRQPAHGGRAGRGLCRVVLGQPAPGRVAAAAGAGRRGAGRRVRRAGRAGAAAAVHRRPGAAAAASGAAAARRAGRTSTGLGRLLSGPWPLAAGAMLLALGNAATLLVDGHPWAITWGFTVWGAKAAMRSAGSRRRARSGATAHSGNRCRAACSTTRPR